VVYEELDLVVYGEDLAVQSAEGMSTRVRRLQVQAGYYYRIGSQESKFNCSLDASIPL